MVLWFYNFMKLRTGSLGPVIEQKKKRWVFIFCNESQCYQEQCLFLKDHHPLLQQVSFSLSYSLQNHTKNLILSAMIKLFWKDGPLSWCQNKWVERKSNLSNIIKQEKIWHLLPIIIYLSLLIFPQFKMFASPNSQHSLRSAVGLNTFKPQHNLLCSFSLEKKLSQNLHKLLQKTFLQKYDYLGLGTT